MKYIKINTDYITLGQFLKFIGIIENGGEAKEYIEINDILVDNQIEKKRGRKLYKKMIIKINKNIFQII